MEDIVPEFLENIEKDFNAKMSSNKKLKELLEKLINENASYVDVNDYSIEIGKILSEVFRENISADKLPDERMYYNIAERILNTSLKNNHDIISKYGIDVQTLLNHQAGLGLKGKNVPLNQNRIDGLIDKISELTDFNDAKWLLGEPIINFSQSIVDEMIKANIEFHSKIGLSAKVTRKADGPKACKWCRSLVGEYSYPDVPQDVYRRHERCRCTVLYVPKKEKGRSVWDKSINRKK